MRDKITFFRSYAEALKDIEDAEEFRSCVLSLLAYSFDGEEIADTALSRMFMALVKPVIDASRAKSEAGRKGGEANGSRTEADRSKSEANGSKPEANRSRAEAKPKQTEASKEYGIGNKEKEKDIESMSYDIDRRTDVTTEDVDRVVATWNTLPASVPKVQKIITGSKRDRQIRARIREYGLTPVILAVEKVRASDFLCGRNKKGWTISFDWFIGPENFPKVNDGNYDARSGTTGAEPASARDYLLAMIHGGDGDERDRDE